jgi:hypothetical protein
MEKSINLCSLYTKSIMKLLNTINCLSATQVIWLKIVGLGKNWALGNNWAF